MAMFDGIKEGDRVYVYPIDEFGVVEWVNKKKKKFKIIYNVREYVGHSASSHSIVNFSGSIFGEGIVENKNPLIFWDKPQFEIPEKPFNIKTEYKKLERIFSETNYDICQLVYEERGWDVEINEHKIIFGAPQFIFNDDMKDFIKKLNKHRATIEELEQVVKEVEYENK